MDLTIAEFSMDDYHRVLSLWKSCDGIGLGDSDSKEKIALFLDRNPGMSFVAEKNGDLAGAVLAGHDGRRGYIHHLAVSEAHRHQGIGRALVENCLERLREAGIGKCHIFLFKTNTGGQKFWASAGWSHRNDISVISKVIDVDTP